MAQPSKTASTVAGSTHKHKPVVSFRRAIDEALQVWNQLQQAKKNYEQEQSKEKRPGFWGQADHAYDEFDRIMEEDLQNQVKELERQQQEQSLRTERILEEQLRNHCDNKEEVDDVERYCMQLLDQFQKKEAEEQRQYGEQLRLSQQVKSPPLPHQVPLLTTAQLFGRTQRVNLNQTDSRHKLDQTLVLLRFRPVRFHTGDDTMLSAQTKPQRAKNEASTSDMRQDQCGNFDIQFIFDDLDSDADTELRFFTPDLDRSPSHSDDDSCPAAFSAEVSITRLPTSDATIGMFAKQPTLADVIAMDFNEIPHYLSTADTSFEERIRAILPRTENLERFRCIAVLMYKIIAIEMIRSLWLVYRKAGTDELQTPTPTKKRTEPAWPTKILHLVRDYQNDRATWDTNTLCLTFVDECLRQFDEKDEEYRQELRSASSCLSDYTAHVECIIEEHVQQGLNCLRVEIECHRALVQFDYNDEIFKQQFLAHHPTERQTATADQLCRLQQDYEVAKQEWTMLNENTLTHLTHHPFDTQSLIRAPLINTMRNPNLQAQLFLQYKSIVEHVKNDQLDIYMNKTKEHMAKCRNELDRQMQQWWTMNKSLPDDQRLSSTALKMIDERLSNISARWACIDKHQKELLHIKSNAH